jgi:hypothetical protein
VAGVAAAALAVGGVAVAQAATSNAPSPSASPSASASPGGDKGTTERGPREAHSPHLAGTVVSAADGTITITDMEGFQRTIHTSSATTYADGLTATPAAGTKIVAEGTVDSDKTSLKATRVAKMPDRPGPGRGLPGGPGRPGGPGFPGGPGRHHDGTPPSGAPTPPSGAPTPPAPPGSGSATPGTPAPAPSTPSASPTS